MKSGKALDAAKAETEKPFLIIGKTIMGKGAVKEDGSSFEKMVSTHGQPLSAAGASFESTVKNLVEIQKIHLLFLMMLQLCMLTYKLKKQSMLLLKKLNKQNGRKQTQN